MRILPVLILLFIWTCRPVPNGSSKAQSADPPHSEKQQNESTQVQADAGNILWTTAWSPDGNYIGVGGTWDSLMIFDATSFELYHSYPFPGVEIARVKWHPEKPLLAIVTQSATLKTRILDLEINAWIDLRGLQNSFRALDWSHDGRYLAVSEFEDYVSVFTENGAPVSRFWADDKGVTGLDWHPTEDIMVTVGSRIGVHSLMGDTLHNFTPRAVETLMLCVEWHPSGRYFAVGDYGDSAEARDKRLEFWIRGGEKVHSISGSRAEYRNIRWSRDGSKLASASDALRIWSEDGKLLAESASSSDYLWGVDWSPDGKRIVTTSANGRIMLWNDQARAIREIKIQ